MINKNETYGLDSHCLEILNEYREKKHNFEILKPLVLERIKSCLQQNGIFVTAIEGRVKEIDSLAGKLERKGSKYSSLNDVTDILGARVITIYDDDVDKIAALIENMFTIDWKNSVDKRKLHQIDSFGYSSLHYICKIPKQLYSDPANPSLNEYSFEIQIRTTLQHVWSSIVHDTGYKYAIELPDEYFRTLNILAGMLELVDNEFSRIRTALNVHRRQLYSLVESGKLDDVPLNEQTFKKYMEIKPFESLNQRIAAINQAEIMEVSLMEYVPILKMIGMKTLGDVERMKKDYGHYAYELARHRIGNTDLDIMTSIIGIQNLCIVYTLHCGKSKEKLVQLLDAIRGKSDKNLAEADHIYELVNELSSL